MLIAVTGASGFIGGRTVRRLLHDGHRVIAFGRREGCVIEGAEYRRWDITSGPIDVGPVDAVVHCSGSVTEWGRRSEFEAVNVAGTRNVLESFRDSPTFVHLSSASVYDLTTSKLAITEDAALGGRYVSDYSASKIQAERLVLARDGNAVVLRPHIVYGPGESKIMPRLVRALNGTTLFIPGDGRNRLSVTHVDNLAASIANAVGWRGGREVFNVADAETATLNELLGTLRRAVGSRARIRHVPFRAAWPAAVASELAHRTLLRSRHPLLTRFVVAQLAFDFTLDIGRARDVLDYIPQRSFAEAFAEIGYGWCGAGGAPSSSKPMLSG